MRYYIYETRQHVAVVDEEKGLYRLGRFDVFDRQPDWKGYWLTAWSRPAVQHYFAESCWENICPRRGARLLKQGGLEL